MSDTVMRVKSVDLIDSRILDLRPTVISFILAYVVLGVGVRISQKLFDFDADWQTDGLRTNV